jgi:4-carboxymuconolactone decarboxylase
MADHTSARLPLIDLATTSQSLAEPFKLLPEINLFRVMANGGPLFPAYMKFLDLLFRPMELNAVLERMLILHISRRSACEYAWRQNTLVAKVVGVKDEQIEAIRKGAVTNSCFTQVEIAAFGFVEEAMDLIEVSDSTFERTKQFFSNRAVAEMLYVVGAYMFVARVARTTRVPLDETDPESALASAAEMIANHQIPAAMPHS